MRRLPLLVGLLALAVAAAAQQPGVSAAKRRNTLGGLGLLILALRSLRR